MGTPVHWHGFTWVGQQRPPDSERIAPSNPTPPLEIAHWLRKPARHVAATHTDPEAATEWMRGHLEQWPEQESELINVDSKTEFTRDCLSRGSDVVFGFYPVVQRYVSLALIACPRDGETCPQPPGR